MLSWTQQADGWHADGYHIELAAPFHWVLTKDTVQPASRHESIQYVTNLPEPLAMARTLTEAKREAELDDMACYRAQVRRRHIAILLTILAVAVLSIGGSPLQSITMVLLVAYFTTRSLGVIAGTLLWKLGGNSRETVFYQ
ncbi:MAG: hypothetical protein QNL12_02240 [Acidimicrobiia bacterium]|nr:hypothetical protein [Acidimicrobiia bacterium]MDX2466106.1 hypothetical protein [Acidimicrobiia bacterium]